MSAAADNSVIEQYHKAKTELGLAIMDIYKLTYEGLAQLSEEKVPEMLTRIRYLEKQIRTLSLEHAVMRFESDSVTAQR